MNTNNLSINELVDIRDVQVNINNPLKDRMQSYISQIKNPYCFKYGDIIISLQFSGDIPLEEKIISYYKNK